MKIVHVIRRLQKSAGTSTFCVEVCNGLAKIGHDVSIAVCCPEDRANFALHPDVKVFHVDSCLGERIDCRPDIVHIHALWTPFLRRVANWANDNHLPVVWSTHGLTAPWAMRHKWWKKMPVWWLYQRRHLGRSKLLHSTTELEAKWNARLGFFNQVVIPLGTNELPGNRQNTCRRLLFVGRLHPVKGLENLIRAWAQVDATKRKGWMLRLVGPDQIGYRDVLVNLIEKVGVEQSVEFPGPLFGDDLSQEYDDCDCLILPSFSENFGATVVDALAHGRPCIASTFTPWKELELQGCGWWVSNDERCLAMAIADMMDVGDERRGKMGGRGRTLIEEKYTWRAVVSAMERAYEGVCI